MQPADGVISHQGRKLMSKLSDMYWQKTDVKKTFHNYVIKWHIKTQNYHD